MAAIKSFEGRFFVNQAQRAQLEEKSDAFVAKQIVDYILAVVEVLLAFRFILEIFKVGQYSFMGFIYSLTNPLMMPFTSAFNQTATSGIWVSLIAAAVYSLVAWGIIRMIKGYASKTFDRF